MSEKPVDLSSSAYVYSYIGTNCILYVPMGSKRLYEVADEWKYFTNIIELPTAIKDVSLSNLKIYLQGTNIIIERAEGYQIEVYNISGQKVIEVDNPTSKESLNILQAGVYVIRVCGESIKVSVSI